MTRSYVHTFYKWVLVQIVSLTEFLTDCSGNNRSSACGSGAVAAVVGPAASKRIRVDSGGQVGPRREGGGVARTGGSGLLISSFFSRSS